MEGFTVVLLISWIILVGCFVAMYFMDEATKKAAAGRSMPVPESQPGTPSPAPRSKRK
jgi:hypothetical protein